MSNDDLVTRLYDWANVVPSTIWPTLREAAARITELEAENAAFREQFADADEVRAMLKQWGATGDLPDGWTKVDYRAENARLREALRYISSPTMALPGDRDAYDFAMDGATELMARGALQICIRTARAALSGEPTP